MYVKFIQNGITVEVGADTQDPTRVVLKVTEAGESDEDRRNERMSVSADALAMLLAALDAVGDAAQADADAEG